jgi:hypothetical protein
MTLPKIAMPLFPIKVPSMDREVLFRPFLVKEEKILLIAQESKEERDIIVALKQIINNCVQEENFKIDKLAYFDLEYIFLKLRAKSVSNSIEFKYTDPEDGQVYTIKVNLDEVEIAKNEKNNPVVMIDDERGLGLRMRFPTVEHTVEYKKPGLNQDEVLTKIVAACIEDVFDSENVYAFDEYTPAQQNEFIDTIPVPVFGKIQEFFDTIPSMKHELTYKTKDKKTKTLTFEGLNDFFTWG